MKSTIMALALVVLLGATPAFAAMPNYIGEDYKQADECTVNDHNVYEIVDGATRVVGCITKEAWSRAIQKAVRLQATGFRFKQGESVTFLNGRVEICPIWFSMECMVERSEIR